MTETRRVVSVRTKLIGLVLGSFVPAIVGAVASERAAESELLEEAGLHIKAVGRHFGDLPLAEALAHERELLPYVRSGHWGGDRRMLDSMFRGIDERPDLERASGLREGVMSVLVGIAARKSIDEGRPVKIDELVSL